MSELKAINAYQLTTNTEDSDVYIHNDEFGCGGDLVECYLKSAADKVIAKQKYKRCLARAEWCDEVMMSCELRGYSVHRIWANKHEWAMRWKYRWLDIADKFNEK